MDHAEVPGMNREQRLSRWIDLYSDTILKTCFLYLSDRQQAEDVCCRTHGLRPGNIWKILT